MKIIIKRFLKYLIDLWVSLTDKFVIGRYFNSQIIFAGMNRTQYVSHNGVEMEFSIPNLLNKMRIETFSSKEPETLEWVDNIPDGSVVWDIGANIGLYSCYAAKSRGCKVFAFEPSVFNLELLARNIVLNDLVGQVVIVPLPLTDSISISKLNMTTTEWGGALSTFDKTYGHNGKPMSKVFEFSTVGITMNDAVKCLDITVPDYIKMDVDGIEHLILKGGQSLLKNVQGVIIEIDDQFDEQSKMSSKYLTEAGLTMVEKRHSQMVEESSFRTAFNQIWSR